MALEILNTDRHRLLRISENPGKPAHFTMITLDEFPAAAAVCPIFFAKDASSGDFYAGAMFGFQPGELLVDWSPTSGCAFQPLDLQRRGFFIAGQDIAIDPAHPRFSDGASKQLFSDSGQPEEALSQIQRIIGRLKSGVDATRDFIAALLSLKVIEPIDIRLNFDDGENLSLDGLYTVSRDALNELDDQQITKLFRAGYLQMALCVAFSQAQIPVMARRRNERLTAIS
ncbi:SapC family protein [Sphingomonas sp.]|uniref:SapC family protein n=1 Tax=Sphingomonas sp. TaxID=28214 RepID=UPI000DB314DE|nr:SapC family protein [Sphingomonas sp.]PZU08851.1 MAG: multidrug transporter [Sphingomonas sp.]